MALIKIRKNKSIFYNHRAFYHPLGNVHGGFIVAMLDETMGSKLIGVTLIGVTLIGVTLIGVTDAACFTKTISMSMIIDFIHPIQHRTVFGEGKTTSIGKNTAFL